MKSLSKPAVETVPITKAALTRWDRLEEKRLKLRRQADDLRREQDKLEEELMAAVAAQAGETRRIELFGFELAITSKKCSVSWKGEFITVAGQTAADKLIAAAPEKDAFEIRKL